MIAEPGCNDTQKQRPSDALYNNGEKAFMNVFLLLLSRVSTPCLFDLKSAFLSFVFWAIHKHWIPIIYFYVRSLDVTFYPCWSNPTTRFLGFFFHSSTQAQMLQMKLINFWLDVRTCLYWYFTVYEAPKTSDDSGTREPTVCKWASEEFTSCQFLLLWFGTK